MAIRREGDKTRAKVVMLVISLCMFAISSAVWALSLVNLIKIIKNVGSPDPMPSLERAFDALNKAGNPLYESIEIIYSINVHPCPLYDLVRIMLMSPLSALPRRRYRHLEGVCVMAGEQVSIGCRVVLPRRRLCG